MRILGIDPGSRRTGFGIVERSGTHTRYLVSGCIRTADGPMGDRLAEIHRGLAELLTDYRPDIVAIENVFVRRNAASALKLGQARGVALCVVAMRGVPYREYSPAEIKQAVVGSGRADKEQVQHMVKALLELPRRPQADAADALACALCHAHHDRDGVLALEVGT